MNTERLQYFLAVAQHRNFTEAAKGFYMTQPAITRQISVLEEELGVRLFHRTTRSVELTLAGELFLEDAERILAQEAQAKERLRQLDAPEHMEMKIGYLHSQCRHFLPQLIKTFQREHPQVKVQLIRQNAAEVQEGLAAGQLDVAFSLMPDLEGYSTYDARKLTSDFYCLVCPKDHPSLEEMKINYEKLATESFACLSADTGLYMYKQFLVLCKNLGIVPRTVEEYPSMADVLFVVECGQAIAFLPYSFRTYMNTDLAFVPLEGVNQSLDLGVAWRTNGEDPSVSWFMKMINDRLINQPEIFF